MSFGEDKRLRPSSAGVSITLDRASAWPVVIHAQLKNCARALRFPTAMARCEAENPLGVTKPMFRRGPLSIGVSLLIGAYAYGLLLGGLSLAWRLLSQNGVPQMLWWQWLLAPLGIGCVALVVEWSFQVLQDRTGFGAETHSRSTKFLHLVVLITVFAALIIGPAIYGIAHS
jgi:hypothetical protein